MTSKDKNYKFIETFRSFLTGLGKKQATRPTDLKNNTKTINQRSVPKPLYANLNSQT